MAWKSSLKGKRKCVYLEQTGSVRCVIPSVGRMNNTPCFSVRCTQTSVRSMLILSWDLADDSLHVLLGYNDLNLVAQFVEECLVFGRQHMNNTNQ